MTSVYRLPAVGDSRRAAWVITSESKDDARAAVDHIHEEHRAGVRMKCHGPYLHRGYFRADVWGDDSV